MNEFSNYVLQLWRDEREGFVSDIDFEDDEEGGSAVRQLTELSINDIFVGGLAPTWKLQYPSEISGANVSRIDSLGSFAGFAISIGNCEYWFEASVLNDDSDWSRFGIGAVDSAEASKLAKIYSLMRCGNFLLMKHELSNKQITDQDWLEIVESEEAEIFSNYSSTFGIGSTGLPLPDSVEDADFGAKLIQGFLVGCGYAFAAGFIAFGQEGFLKSFPNSAAMSQFLQEMWEMYLDQS